MALDGVIRFEARHREGALPGELAPLVETLDGWRTRLREKDLIGQDGVRYGGAAWGNLSARLEGERFLITGSQTGGLPHTDARHWAVVEHCDVDAGEGQVQSLGPVKPSSEAMTHAALYRLRPDARFVFHAHCPALFHAQGLPATPPGVEYGTPEMARAVSSVLQNPQVRLFVMRGHEDGVMAFGATAEEAGRELLGALTRVIAWRRLSPSEEALASAMAELRRPSAHFAAPPGFDVYAPENRPGLARLHEAIVSELRQRCGDEEVLALDPDHTCFAWRPARLELDGSSEGSRALFFCGLTAPPPRLFELPFLFDGDAYLHLLPRGLGFLEGTAEGFSVGEATLARALTPALVALGFAPTR